MPTTPNGSLSIDCHRYPSRWRQPWRSLTLRRAGAAIVCGWALVSGGTVTFAEPQETRSSVDSLKKLSVTDLMNIPVTSVSRTEEPRQSVAAAVTVVTNEDIRRSGATSIPEALRLVPGLHVARQSASQWAVSARGFSSVNSEKLLVLSDTRSIYTPLFSGVFWDAQDYLMEDIERIETIRGPGATQWGANAVNGVINITTKRARDTQGLYAEVNSGTEEHVSAGVRYGGTAGGRGHYRLFGKYFDRDQSFHTVPGRSDDWNAGRVGGRADWDLTEGDTVTVQGELYTAEVGQLSPAVEVSGAATPTGALRTDLAGGNALASWRRRSTAYGDFQMRAYYDRTHRDDRMFVDDLHTFDVDFQNRIPGSRHEIIWGLNYRVTANTNRSKLLFNIEPPSSTDRLYSGFVQDHVGIGDRVRITLGTKLEHNDFSGFEAQPSARVAWDLNRVQMVWGAASHAVRVPTRLERDFGVRAAVDQPDPDTGGVIPLLLEISGNPDFEPERLVAYEAGYRWQAAPALGFDVAAFHNRYDRLVSLNLNPLSVDPLTGRIRYPLQYVNGGSGHSQGAETTVTYAPVPSSRFSATYSYMHLSLHNHTPLDINRHDYYEDATPRHQVGLRSSLDLPSALQADALFRFVGRVRRMQGLEESIPDYAELDLRLAWGGWRGLEIALVGQNLLHDRHREFGRLLQDGQVERAGYARVAWGF